MPHELPPQLPQLSEAARQIFEAYFHEQLTPADYERALAIFTDIGALNEHSLALQMADSHTLGKLDKVLEFYETLMTAYGTPANEQEFIERGVAVRRAADIVYLQLLCDGDTMKALRLRGEVEANRPPTFEMLGRLTNGMSFN